MKRRIILLGPPGSGKGTIAARLQTDFGFTHVSSGHLFRKEVDRGSVIGQKAKVFLDNGELVPDEVVLELMGRWLESAPFDRGLMFDGFPRNLGQARVLDGWLAGRDRPVEVVLFYDCDQQIIVRRLTGRRSCPGCGRAYHVETMPSRTPGVCDDCGSRLIQREDDTEPVVRKRYETYHRQTEPLAGYYQKQGKLAKVDAALPLEERLAATVAALD